MSFDQILHRPPAEKLRRETKKRIFSYEWHPIQVRRTCAPGKGPSHAGGSAAVPTASSDRYSGQSVCFPGPRSGTACASFVVPHGARDAISRDAYTHAACSRLLAVIIDRDPLRFLLVERPVFVFLFVFFPVAILGVSSCGDLKLIVWIREILMTAFSICPFVWLSEMAKFRFQAKIASLTSGIRLFFAILDVNMNIFMNFSDEPWIYTDDCYIVASWRYYKKL